MTAALPLLSATWFQLAHCWELQTANPAIGELWHNATAPTLGSIHFGLVLPQPFYHSFYGEEDGNAHGQKVGNVDGILLIIWEVEEGEEGGVEEGGLAVCERCLAEAEGLWQATLG